tara:strand:- start:360 stop:875 length:516 start_codon:yes stop_codon:yes gene_type:complete
MGRAIPDWANPNKIPDIYTTKAQQDLWQRRQRETRKERIDEARRNRPRDTKKGSVLQVQDYRLTDAELKSLLPPTPPKPTTPTPVVPQESLKISTAAGAPEERGIDVVGSSQGPVYSGGSNQQNQQTTTTDDLKIDSGKKTIQPKKPKKPKKDAGNPSDTGGGGGAGETNL